MAEATSKSAEKTLMYKGKPLVREGNILYYGFPTDKAILYMNIPTIFAGAPAIQTIIISSMMLRRSMSETSRTHHTTHTAGDLK